MQNTTIKKAKSDTGGELYKLTLTLTRGEMIAITRALRFYDSPVGNDVLGYITYTLETEKDKMPTLHDDITTTLEQAGKVIETQAEKQKEQFDQFLSQNTNNP
jgi:hypothetical protein